MKVLKKIRKLIGNIIIISISLVILSLVIPFYIILKVEEWIKKRK
ncbi:MAG: hypothetical protein ACP5F8_02620 [Candidatus Aenigmatarchaeota archaeon]